MHNCFVPELLVTVILDLVFTVSGCYGRLVHHCWYYMVTFKPKQTQL